MKSRITLVCFVLTGILGSAALSGCKDDSDIPKSRVLEGRVKDIDVASGVLTGKFYIKKQNEEVELKGKLAPDAEILINGVTAALGDLKVDDMVTVTGWEEKRGNDRKLIAKKVEVTRPLSSQPAGGSKPSTAPA